MAAALDTLSHQQNIIPTPSLLQHWTVVRAQELTQVWRFLTRAAGSRSFPSDAPLSHSAVLTAFCALALGQFTVVLVTGIGRRQILLVLQTVIASLLLLALMGVVLGLPIGAAFLIYKASLLLLSLIMDSQWAAAVLEALPLSTRENGLVRGTSRSWFLSGI
ncbi:hypothetical protein WJX73_010836 [Symbiochloris irregularis]|uniref:Uncharacterized protein n=1 Tax=Symbiochloris irregularis TaxID=706552 RepID=A0AAW1NJX6_9CHLO